MAKQHSEYRKMFPGENFITPDVIGYDRTAKGTVYELSKGQGIFTPMLYGVTIHAEHNPTGAWSACFDTLEEAKAFIKEL